MYSKPKCLCILHSIQFAFIFIFFILFVFVSVVLIILFVPFTCFQGLWMVMVLAKSQLLIFQRDGSYFVMQVEMDQWRAAIGGFQTSMQKIIRTHKIIWPCSILSQIIKLCWLCYNAIAISVLVLPLAIIIQFLSAHCSNA